MGAMRNGNERAIAGYGSLEQLPQHQNTSTLATAGQENGKDEPRFRRQEHFLSLRTLVTITVVVALCAGFLHSWRTQPPTNLKSTHISEYEYIVAGGGPAGILVASKLADYLMTTFPIAPPKVLLLESGTDTQSSVDANIREKQSGLSSKDDDFRLNKFDMPLLWSGVASSRDNDQEHHWPIKETLLARALGGCGLHNAMIYVRSLPNDFERWNLKGWTWDDVLPHYKSLERFVMTSSPSFWNDDDKSLNHKPWRGHDGPIVTVSAGPAIDAVAPLFVESAITSRIPLAAQGFNDPSASKRVGTGYYEFNIRNGVRDSVAQAILGKAYGRRIPPNLEVRTGATVTRIITDTLTNGTPKAIAVEYFTNNSTEYQQAILTKGGEAILAAGAIMTPQLLANSGIGEHGTVAKLPGVGKNLHDHPVIALAFELKAKLAEKAPSMFSLASEFQNYFSSVEHLRNAEQEGKGNKETNEWASLLGPVGTAGFSAGAFLKSPWAQYGSPDIQLTVFPRIVEPHVIRRDVVVADDPYLLESTTMLVTVALLQPEGRYEVQTSKSMFDTVVAADSEINTRSAFGERFGFRLPSLQKTSHLTDMDVKRLSWGMNKVRRILSFDPLKNLTKGELYPGSHVMDSELLKYIRANHLTNSHWVGSTKMGSADDQMAVVDERLRVRGVDGLRVVDAGVIPHIPNGNTHSTVCVVASRAAEMIIADRSYSIRTSQNTS